MELLHLNKRCKLVLEHDGVLWLNTRRRDQILSPFAGVYHSAPWDLLLSLFISWF